MRYAADEFEPESGEKSVRLYEALKRSVVNVGTQHGITEIDEFETKHFNSISSDQCTDHAGAAFGDFDFSDFDFSDFDDVVAVGFTHKTSPAKQKSAEFPRRP